MYTAAKQAETKAILQTTIPQMNQLGIPVTPQNYDIWYRYVSGENCGLSTVIDDMIARDEQFTEETMNTLHEQFSNNVHQDELEELREELQSLVTEMYKSVGEIAGQSNGLSDTLIDSALLMSSADSVQDIRDIISQVVSDTREFGEKSAKLGGQFDKAQQEMAVMRKTLTSLQNEIRRDELTGIPNRKAFDEMIEKQISLGKRKNRPFSLFMIDIDHFKAVNDTYGHIIGDEILKFIARRLDMRLRTEDMIARFGGEEFTAILPETKLIDAVIVANALREYFSKTRLTRDTEPKTIGQVTISIGVAEYKTGETIKDIIARADAALYDAKESGRDQVKASEN